MSKLTDEVKARALELANKLEKDLGPSLGLLMLVFSRIEESIDLVVMTSTQNDGETLKLLRETQRIVLKEKSGEERWFQADSTSELVNAGAVTKFGGHDRVRIWSRGGLAGELVVEAGDGAEVLQRLGLTER